MGYTFIALQGFDLIAAVGGEVRNPSRTLPRAIILSLVIALAIYLPLLFVIETVGVPAGQSIASAAAADNEGIVAIAAEQFLGRFGYWLVIVAAVLSMFSALQANLFAASRIAFAMAEDRTLPAPLGAVHARFRTPVIAIGVTAILISIILVLLPDVSAAGAAASLIFLITFALTHWVAILVRQRSSWPSPFQVPLFPVVPVIGGLACVGLAVFQGIAVPKAGMIAVIWLSAGGILFLSLFARRARVRDASSTALDPELITLRGRTPLVLVPVANPQNAEAMIMLADALVPANVGRVLMQSVAVAPPNWQADDDPTPIERSQAVLYEMLRASAKTGIRVESLTTLAAKPMEEIERVARLHRCESVLLGLSEISDNNQATHLESLLGSLDANVVVLRSGKDWRLTDVRRILVPIAGRGGHEYLRAQLLGSLMRTSGRELTFLRVLPKAATADDVRHAQRELHRLVDDEVGKPCVVEVVQSDDALATVVDRANKSDLLILGVQRHGRRKKLFGGFTRQIAKRTACTIIVMSRRG
jgi:nucleotide-binding universal stress UspA family protein